MNGTLLTLASAALFTGLVALPNERVGLGPRAAGQPLVQPDTGGRMSIKGYNCPPGSKLCLNVAFSDSGVVSGGGHYEVARRGRVLNVIQLSCQAPAGVIQVGDSVVELRALDSRRARAR